MNSYILPGIVIFLAFFFALTYNRLVGMRNIVDTTWANIDTLLQKRFDLVPNLVATVKGYMQHERDLLEEIALARSTWLQASSVKDSAGADNRAAGALKTLFALSENYPELKANQNFLLLQEELTALENKIAYARQRYNRTVMAYNTAVMRFPTSLLAALFKFGRREYFAAESDQARQAVAADF